MFPTEPAAVNNGFGALLKNRSFILLWIGQLISQLADKVFFLMLVDLVVDKNSSYLPPAGVAQESMYPILMVAFTIPAVLFGSAGGVFVDRLPKKLIMVGSDVLRGLLTIALAFLPRDFYALFLITFGVSTVTQFFAPAEQAAIPLLVRRENLIAANALFTSTMMGALIVGFLLGDPLLSLAETGIAKEYGRELVVALLYLLSAVSMLPIHFRDQKLASEVKGDRIDLWADLKEGLRYLKKNRLVLNAMLQITVLYCVFAALMVLALPLAEKFALEGKQSGRFIAAVGIGIVIGAGILGHWGDKTHRKPLPLIGFLGMALILVLVAFTKTQVLALGFCILLGVSGSLIGVPMQTLVQQQTPPIMHGKVFGFQNHAVNIALSAPLAITGWLNQEFGLRIVLVAMSLIVAAVGVWAWQNTRRVLQDVI
ncbi:MFS transporter [Nostocaceae cyanobacterium CENA369]|uniref:MFS transporter n=1 Tax=Dendronalium phyllosphericum CENA369 TaxID=1725256 RepID=A0A8J7LEN2_9NOST|nr:MFS transporter [Dendronalium phyllosphericum]MBH8572959.1 MFS transporter [Dendronalium phyllosphericum CENA369]